MTATNVAPAVDLDSLTPADIAAVPAEVVERIRARAGRS